MRARSIAPGEQQVQPLLGVLERSAHREPEITKPRSANRDQQRLDRLRPLGQIGQPLLDQLRPGNSACTTVRLLATTKR